MLSFSHHYAAERLGQPARRTPVNNRPVRDVAPWLLLLTGLALPLLMPTVWGGLWLAVSVSVLCCLVSGVRWLWPLVPGLILGFLAGVDWAQHQLPTGCEGQSVTLSGRITDFPTIAEIRPQVVRQRFSFQPDQAQSPETPCGNSRSMTLSYWQALPRLRLGDRVTVVVRLRPIASQWSFGVLPDQARMAANAIDAMGTVQSLSKAPLASENLLVRWRNRLDRAIGTLDTDPRIRGVMAALSVGRGSGIESDDWRLFRHFGLTHAFVISGLHIGLVAGLALWLVRRLQWWLPTRLRMGRRLPVMVAVGAAWLYSALAGFSIPVQRALIMVLCLALPSLLGWRTRPWRGLLLAIAVLVAANPHWLLSSSLWMSAVATGVLIALGSRRARGVWRLQELLRVQVLLVLTMAPLTVFWFGEISLWSVAANLALVPLIGLWIVPLVLGGALFEGVIGAQYGNGLWVLATWSIEWLLTLLDSLGQRDIGWGVLSVSLGLMQTTLLTLGIGAIGFRQRKGLALALILWLLALALDIDWLPVQQAATLTVLDVGQGLSVVWQEGDWVLLYDTGDGSPGGFTQAEKTVLPYLNSQRVGALNTLVISHGDSDHSGGMTAIGERYPTTDRLGYRGQPCRVGAHWRWPGGSRFTVLNGDGQGRGGRNGSSCVLLIEYGSRRILLTGDIDRERERDLVRYWKSRLDADVLVAAHHGSDTSSGWTFLKWVRPRLVAISAGRANHFGHPHGSVLDRLGRLGADIHQTARDGAIRYHFARNGEMSSRARRQGYLPYWLLLPALGSKQTHGYTGSN